MSESFLLLFFKKEALSFLNLCFGARRPPTRAQRNKKLSIH